MNAQGFTAVEDKDSLQNAVPYSVTLMEGPSPNYSGPYAKVTFQLGITIPSGPYQNVRPMATLEVPCHPANIEAAYEFAQNWCDAKMTEMRSLVESAVGTQHG